MEIKSKIELRHEALTLALQTEAGKSNPIKYAKEIEKYIQGDVELPEKEDPDKLMKELFKNTLGVMGRPLSSTPNEFSDFS